MSSSMSRISIPMQRLAVSGRCHSKNILFSRSPVIVRSYHENVIDHYENPRNVGSLDKNSKKVGKLLYHIHFTIYFLIFFL